MDIDHATRIARTKGLTLRYDKEDKAYILSDRLGLCLMNYAPITLSMISETRWRIELNTMRASR